MGYTTTQEIIDRFGGTLMTRLTEGANPDTAMIELAIGSASGMMDAYLGRRVPVPLTAAPPAIKRLCQDLVIFELKQSRHSQKLTDQDLAAHRLNIRMLEQYASGELNLEAEHTPQVIPTISIQSRRRIFGRVE